MYGLDDYYPTLLPSWKKVLITIKTNYIVIVASRYLDINNCLGISHTTVRPGRQSEYPH